MKRTLLLILLLSAELAWAGGEHAVSEAPAAEGAVFKEGEGITLSEETRIAIGLKTAEVIEGLLAAEQKLAAQVYRTARESSQNSGERQGCAYASALLRPTAAEMLAPGAAVEIAGLNATGRVVAVEHTMQAAANQCEALIEIPDPHARLAIGDFIQGRLVEGPAATVMQVPRAAILESAGGAYAYVLNGTAFFRTLVTTGVRNADRVEIVDGLYAGDVVAATAVETLYLIELRATKGGGHCH